MPVTRINNNQISDSSAGNLYLGIDASTKLQDYSITAGKIANSLTYGSDLTIAGNLTVQGNTTTIDTVNVVVEDPLILLAAAQTGSPTLDIGFIGKRGTEDNIAMVWDESEDAFVTAFTSSEVTNTTIAINSYASFKTLDATVTGNLDVTGTSDFTGNITINNLLVNGPSTLDMGNSIISNVAEPVANTDVATKAYVDSQSASGFTIEDDTANTTVVSGGDTLQLYGTANEVEVAITGSDQVTFGLPTDVTVTGNLDANNLSVTNNIDAVKITASGNLEGNNAVITNDLSTTTVTASGDIITTAGVQGNSVTATGNLSGNNASITNTLDATTITATGNISGGNVISTALVQGATVTATGNLNGNNAVITNNVSASTIDATGNITGGNINTAGTINGAAGEFTGNVGGGNVISNGIIIATGNVSGGNVIAVGGVTSTTVVASGNVDGANLNTVGTVTATGNITGGNIITSGSVTATANVSGGNLTTAGNIDGGNLNVTGGTYSATVNATGNISGANLGISGVAVVTGNITGGNLITSGNIDGGNLNVTGGTYSATVDATGNVTGGNLTTAGLVDAGNVVASGNVTGGNLVSLALVSGTTVTASGNVNANNVIATSEVFGATLVASGNIDGANLNISLTAYAGNVEAAGNVDAGTAVNTNAIHGNPLALYSQGDLSLVATGNILGNGSVINNIADPIQPQDAATKYYVDSIAQGLNIHASVEAATPGNLATITGGTITYNNGVSGVGATLTTTGSIGNIDGVPVNTVGTRVLVKNEPTLAYNGIYTYANSTTLVRALDYDTPTEIAAGDLVFVNSGDTYENSQWVQIDNITTVGTDPIVWEQFGGAGTYSAGNGIAINGTVILAKVDEVSTSFDAGGNIVVKSGAVLVDPILGNAIANSLTVAGNGLISATTVDVTGNVLAGNVNSNALVTAASAEITGNILAGNLNSNAAVTGVTGTFSGNIDGANLGISGVAVVTGNVTGGNFVTAGAVDAATVTATGNVAAGNLVTLGTVDTATLTATGNITGGNLNTAGNAAATYFLGNGAFLTGVTASSVNAADLTGNTLSANVLFSSLTTVGNLVDLTVDGTATVGNLSTGGTVTATGNVSGANLVTAGTVDAATVTATGNISGGNLISNGAVIGNIQVSGNINVDNVIATGNVDADNINATNEVNGATADFTGNVSVGNLSTNGEIVGGLIISTSDINAVSGNVNAGNIIALNLLQGTTVTATGNINAGNATITNTLVAATGDFSGNVDADNLIAGQGVYSATVDATGNITGGNIATAGAVTSATVTATGNIGGANLNASAGVYSATMDATGNITGGNIVTAGTVDAATVTATGNVSANNVIATTSGQFGNIVISGDDITDTNGRVNINTAGADVDFAVNGDTTANLFYVDAGTGTASFGSATQTTGAIVSFNSTETVLLPVGNTAQRPTGVTGMFRYNTTEGAVEWYDGAAWQSASSDFTVIVDDSFQGDGSTTTFTLSQNSTTAGTIVTINGVVQIPTTAYAVTGNSLQFTEAPEVSDTIDARILTTTATVDGIEGAGGASFSAGSGLEFLVTGDLIPTANVTYDLGNSTNWWNNGYFSGTTIHLGGLQLKAVGNVFSVYDSDGTTPASFNSQNIDTTSISNGTSNMSVIASGGNIRANVGGSTIQTVSASGVDVTGYVNATGNVNGLNVNGTVVNGTTSVIGGGITLNANTISSAGSTMTLDPSAPGVTGLVVVAGNLQVNGTTITVDSTTITINDLVFTVANNAATAAAANGGGIEVGPVGSPYATWTYDQPNARWTTGLGIAATGNITGGNLSVGTGTITVGNIVNSNANGVGNIGSSTTYFNTVFAKATSAQYADLAEMYEADQIIEPGTVVVFGGAKEVTVCAEDGSKRIAGVVSTNPSYIMNAGLQGDNVVAVALTGRVPVKVTGSIRKGDMIVAAGDGRARAEANPQVGQVIGKALADFDGIDGVIEVVVGRL